MLKKVMLTFRAQVEHILSVLQRAKNPAVLIDGCVLRFHVENEVREFADKSGFPVCIYSRADSPVSYSSEQVYEAPMGKGAISEFHPHFRGSYVGKLTPESVRRELESMDVVLFVGSIKSDFNTGGFTFSIPPSKLIELHSDHATIFYATYPKVGFRGVLKKLNQRLSPRPFTLPPPTVSGTHGVEGDDSAEIRHEYFW